MHNAEFDLGFLNNEINILQSDYPTIESVSSNVIDTLQLARAKHPGQRNSLDALVDRYQIHGYDRNYHGALLDSKILAEVYLSMTGGQTSIGFSQEMSQPGNRISKTDGKKFYKVSISQEESNEHLNYLKSIRE
jgi:DNA polymerase-3 subunit epsilon